MSIILAFFKGFKKLLFLNETKTIRKITEKSIKVLLIRYPKTLGSLSKLDLKKFQQRGKVGKWFLSYYKPMKYWFIYRYLRYNRHCIFFKRINSTTLDLYKPCLKGWIQSVGILRDKKIQKYNVDNLPTQGVREGTMDRIFNF